jgi:hypothetical protein
MSSLRACRSLAAATLALGAAALVASCGGGTTGSKPPAHAATPAAAAPAAALASLPPRQILSKALAAAAAAGSVHFTGTDRSSSGTTTYDQNASAGEGNQIITTSGGGRLTIRVVAGVGYLRGNATALSQIIPNGPVSQLAGRWIAIHPGDPGYQDFTDGVTLASVLAEFTPTGSLASTDPQTVDGQSVIGVKGVAPAAAGVLRGQPVTLYMMAAGRPLPVAFQGGSGTDQENVAFTGWGETVHMVVPANSLPITSLAGS